ncbi:TetR/AcrR family transcriptional regulator [Actinocorallia libanotica]|uniref:HTH tetR-type domain-containing protein n=1 Tax=Actinocorallia libanotica TaxID=46162 RepID=A0ABN1RMJ3_9ACTN
MRETTEEGAFDDDPITAAALRLFAGIGYDNTSARMIADAAGVDLQEVQDRGGKSTLYKRIVEDFQQEQRSLYEKGMADYASGPEGLRRHLDDALDLYLSHPLSMAIWQHRYLEDAADLAEVDVHRSSVFRWMEEMVGPEIAGHPDYRLIVNLFAWSVYGFLFGGVITENGVPMGPDTAEGRRRFRAMMHRLSDFALQMGIADSSWERGRPSEG